MSLPITNEPPGLSRKVFSPTTVAALAMVAIGASYCLAIAEMEVAAKTRGFSAIIAVFLAAVVGLRFLQGRGERPQEVASVATSHPDAGLGLLDEAHDTFAGALSPDDTFRLAANRVSSVVPSRTVVLYVYDEQSDRLRVMRANGADSEKFRGVAISPREGQPGECFCTKRVQIDAASATIPLEAGDSAFGVLQLLFDEPVDPGKQDLSLFDAIGTRIGPLVMSSVAFERTLSTALVDSTTELPNERAFFMVLENHIAESQRNRDVRPLTVIALDVRGFNDVNQRFGHRTGDRVLAFVADVVKERLRQMDFFARSAADEFVAVLPTANVETATEIIERIRAGFLGRKFNIGDEEGVEVEVNIGWASFGPDGETPASLLAAARERKVQSKSMVPPKVLWFPTEFAN